MYPKLIFSSLLVFAFSSCSEPKAETKEVIIEKTVVKEVDSAAIANDNPEMAKLQEEVLGLNKETEAEKQTISNLNSEVKSLNQENDSLKTSINQKDNIIRKLAAPDAHKISNEELQIRSLMQYLNNAWVNLPGANNTDYFLDLFLPEFSVSMLSVGIDDKAVVRTMDKADFTGMLNDVRKRKNFSIQIGNVDYVYFDGRNNIYSIVYTAILRSYQDEVPVMDRSFVATVTVKKVDDKWKIGKYSWAAMGHELK
jgi:regulator of replication initiation timing